VSRRIKRNWKQRLASWLLRNQPVPIGCGPSPFDEEVDVSLANEVKLNIRPAQNGRLITMQVFQPTNSNTRNGNQWQTTLYLVPEGHDLIEAITVLLVGAKTGR